MSSFWSDNIDGIHFDFAFHQVTKISISSVKTISDSNPFCVRYIDLVASNGERVTITCYSTSGIVEMPLILPAEDKRNA